MKKAIFVLSLLCLTYGEVKSQSVKTFVVTSSGDEPDTDLEDGIFDPPTLRSAIENANLTNGLDEITFAGITTVNVINQLPVITSPVIISGSLPNMAKVVINGGGVITDFLPGFVIGPLAEGSELSNLAIKNFSLGAILLNSDNNEISNNYIGTADGVLAEPNGDPFVHQSTPAIHVKGDGNIITNNLISGNFGYGIRFEPATDSSGIEIQNNIIGLDSTGSGYLGNSFGGILINQGAGAINGNVISDNDGFGINIDGGTGSEEYKLEISGNMIGVNLNGTLERGNEFAGIRTERGFVVIEDNVISHNDFGILSYGESVHIFDNYIGVDITGSKDFGNEKSGIIIYGDKSIVGGEDVSKGNIISGNDNEGVLIYSSENVISNNFIGLNISGDSAIGNTYEGIKLENGSRANVVIENVISGNGGDGLELVGVNDETIILGNLIGTDLQGTDAIGNSENGILITDGYDISVGGMFADDGNIISGNGLYGIQSFLQTTKPDTLEELQIMGNYIGVDVTGTVAMGNSLAGILLPNWNSSVERNVIGANLGAIIIEGKRNRILGNHIGVDVTGTNQIGNLNNGIVIKADSNIVGDPHDNTTGNIISASQYSGILVFGGSNFNSIAYNYIGVDATGVKDFGNGRDGITFGANSSRNLVYRNVISGNAENGIELSSNNINFGIYANSIGTDASGQHPISNLLSGIYIKKGDNIDIGEPVAGNGNLISGNNGYGIELVDHISENMQKGISIKNNIIGTKLNAGESLKNDKGGIKLREVRKVTVGGEFATLESNVIAGNDTVGIFISDGSVEAGEPIDSIEILGNYIGLDSNLDPVPNSGPGIYVDNLFDGGVIHIGKDSLANRNIIAFNEGTGIGVLGKRIVFMEFNQIYNNDYLAIDLNYDGISYNDEIDTDESANRGLNYPVIENATYNKVDEIITIYNRLQTELGDQQYFVDYYYNEECDEFEYGEAEHYLNNLGFYTNESGFKEDSIQVSLPYSNIDHLDGIYVTANTFSHTFGTSEMSRCFYITLKGSGGNEPDLVLTKTDSMETVEGTDLVATFAYQISVINSGLKTAMNVTVTDTIPSHLVIGEVSASVDSFSLEENILTVEVDSLSPGDSIMVYIPVESTVSGEVINSAYVYTDSEEASVLNNQDSDTTLVSITVNNEESVILDTPKEFNLNQNYPNPFNPSTTISYEVSERTYVEVSIFNLLGMKVATLVREVKQPGIYSINWDASGFASDVYFYQMKAGNFLQTKSMILIK